MKLKHSKYRNTGILFELLVRQITADTLKGGESPALPLLKKTSAICPKKTIFINSNIRSGFLIVLILGDKFFLTLII